jgi:hypothetical protein
MLPVQHPGLTRALTTLSQLQLSDSVVRLRVGLVDGTVLDGVLHSASADHVSIVLPRAQARYIAARDIRSVHRARRRPLRKLGLLALGIILATAAVVAMYEVPFLREHLPQAVGIFVLLAAAGATQVIARTGLGGWLTSWESLFDTRPG